MKICTWLYINGHPFIPGTGEVSEAYYHPPEPFTGYTAILQVKYERSGVKKGAQYD